MTMKSQGSKDGLLFLSELRNWSPTEEDTDVDSWSTLWRADPQRRGWLAVLGFLKQHWPEFALQNFSPPHHHPKKKGCHGPISDGGTVLISLLEDVPSILTCCRQKKSCSKVAYLA